MRTVQITFVALVLTLPASAGDLSDSTAVNADIKPGRSGEDRSCSMWVPWRGDQVYRGAGGTTKSVDGMEMWVTGRPSRLYKQVGYMIFFLPEEPHFSKCVDLPRESDAARVARLANGDAVVPLGRSGNRVQYRVIKYLSADEVGNVSVTDEGVSTTFDNAAAVHPALKMITAKPMAIAMAPRLIDFVPRELLKAGTKGIVEIKVCTGTDGRLDRPTEIVVTSGVPALDNAAVQWASAVTYWPQMVDDKPTPGCKSIRVTF
jgi:hypothetical protein